MHPHHGLPQWRPLARLTFVLVLPALLAACGTSNGNTGAPPPPAVGSPAAAASGKLIVFAASSLPDAFNVVGPSFEKANPAVKVSFNYDASATLRTKLTGGARADVFAPADQANMDQAKHAGVIDGPDTVFAKNELVVIYPAINPGKIGTLRDLANPGLRLALAEPGVALGAYARQVLVKMAQDPSFGAGFDQKVLANLKSQAVDVPALVRTVQRGQADAAIVYTSSVTPAVAKDVHSIPIADALNVIASYPIAVVKGAANRPAALAFIAYLRSPAGQMVLKQNGFIVDADTGGVAVQAPTVGGH